MRANKDYILQDGKARHYMLCVGFQKAEKSKNRNTQQKNRIGANNYNCVIL